MNRNKLIIAAVLILIAILTVGMVAGFSDSKKTDTKLKIKVKSPIHEGDKVKIMLTDINGTPLANKTVNVTITDSDNDTSNRSLATNAKGIAKLKVNKDEGEYVIKCSFGGDDMYNGNETKKKINVEEEVVEEEVSDPGAFYSEQEGRVIYTGEVHDAPDGNRYEHLGNNEWVRVD